MANAIFGFPNFIDSDYYVPRLWGGSWLTAAPLSNLQDRFLTRVARSSDAALASTKFNLYFDTIRNPKVFAFPNGNWGRYDRYRMRFTATPRWGGVVVHASATAGASSLTLRASAGAADLDIGDAFLIAGDPTLYIVGTNTTISSGGTASVSISPNLVVSVSASAVVTCTTGDYASPEFDSGWKDCWRQVYQFGDIPFGHPSFWDLKLSDEEARFYPKPVREYTGVSPIIVNMGLIEFDLTAGSNTYLEIPRFFSSSGFQPTINIAPGDRIGWDHSETVVQTAKGGARWYDKTINGRRIFTCDIANLPESEALAWVLDMQKRLGKDGQLLFVYDPENDADLHRTMMICTMRDHPPLGYQDFQRRNVSFVLEEVIQ